MEDRRSPRWGAVQTQPLVCGKVATTAERERYQAREDVRLKCDDWHKMQPMLDPARLVFIDETGLDTARVRRYGWGECGQRVRGSSPQGGIGTRARSWRLYASGT
ncbi:MAG: hypothetical protein ACXWTH_12595 [Methylosarcina sp.]